MKNWKKKAAGLLLTLTGSLFLFGCSAKEKQNTATLYQKGLEIVEKMDLTAECGDYISLVSSSLELNDLIDDIAEKDYTKPDTVYQVTIKEEAVKEILSLAAEENLQIPEEILPAVYRRLVSSVPNILNAAEGSAALAVTSILTADIDFLYKDLTDYTIYLYLYQDAYSAVVVFSPMEDGIVRATGSFLVGDQLLWNFTPEEIMEVLEENGYFTGCEVQKIEIEQK